MRVDTFVGHPTDKLPSNPSVRSAVAKPLSLPVREDDQLEATPLEGERLFQAAFERAVIGIAHVSPQGHFLRFNQRLCDFLGYRPEELAVRTYQEVTHPDDFEPCMASFQRLLSGDIEEYAMEKRHLRKDGTLVWAHVAVSLVRTPEGAPDFTVTMIQDIDERKRLEQEREAARADELAAREANRRMEQFLATAAHDLRSPLTATIGYLDLAERQAERLASTAAQDAPPDLARQVATMHTRLNEANQGAERLARLLTLLFDTAALHADRLELHRMQHDLAALVREQVAALCVAAPGRTIRLHIPAPAGDAPIPVEVDADRIGQVLTNFVTNALKYSPSDRPVDVSVMVRGSRARVAVCDQGRGIPKGERLRVWELFHRVPGVTTQSGTHSGSLGLGLHISKAIVEAHGGRVGMKSTVGQGSTFWFTLPLSTELSGLSGATS